MYATDEDVKQYTGIKDLPEDVNRLILRAGEVVDSIIISRPKTDRQHTAVQQATCAQVEYWLSIGEDVDFIDNITSINIGNFSMSINSGGRDSGNSSGGINQVAPRAYRSLLHVGLLNRGVRMS